MSVDVEGLLTQVRERRDRGELREAEEAARAAVAAAPQHAEARRLLGTVLWREGRNSDAIVALQEAVAIEPANVKALIALCAVLGEEGWMRDSLEAARHAISVAPESVEAWHRVARLKTFVPNDPDLRKLEELASRRVVSEDEFVSLAFALAKAYEDVSDTDRAFSWLRRGNDAKRRTLSFDIQQPLRFYARVEETFGSDLAERFAGAGYVSELPVFVIGMPRSGTSLVEQILASHPLVHGAGELMDMQELSLSLSLLNEAGHHYPEAVPRLRSKDFEALGAGYVARRRADAPDAQRVVDKHPLNFRYVGLMKLMLPAARIIHCVRDPADACVSMYGTNFEDLPFSYDLGELGRYYCAYSRLMEHWQRVFPNGIFNVVYEELVADLEGCARGLIDHCGLGWDKRCLEFHATPRTVRTASFAQVRRPLYQSSVGRWRRYEPHLGSLLEELESCV